MHVSPEVNVKKFYWITELCISRLEVSEDSWKADHGRASSVVYARMFCLRAEPGRSILEVQVRKVCWRAEPSRSEVQAREDIWRDKPDKSSPAVQAT